MNLVIAHPRAFFFDLLTESKSRHKIPTDELVEVYLIDLLTELAISNSRFNFTDSISILYLQACQDENYKDLRTVGDSCLLLLGFFQSQATQRSHELYKGIGPTSYSYIPKPVYQRLAQRFDTSMLLLSCMQVALKGSNVIPFHKGLK